MRLLDEPAAGASDAPGGRLLLGATLDADRERWFILERGDSGPRLVPASDATDATLVRLLEVGPHERVRAEWTFASAATGDTAAPSARLVPILAAEDAAVRARVTEDHRVPLLTGDEVPLARLLRERVASGGQPGQARWIDPGKRAVAELPASAEAAVFAVVAWGTGLQGVTVHGVADRGAGGEGHAVPQRAIVRGEDRIVVRLDPGARVELPLPPDADLAQLRYGIALAGDEDDGEPPRGPAGASESARWSVYVVTDVVAEAAADSATDADAADIERDAVLVDFADADPDLLRNGFVDCETALQRDTRHLANPALRFTNEGQVPLLIAQPIADVRLGSAARRPPDLLVLSLDTLRADHLSVFGYARPTSPFLERFARDAFVFRDAMAPASHTLASHVSMFSGLLPRQHGVLDARNRVEPALVPWLPLLLAGHGYATAAFTGGGFVSAAFGMARGFDRFAMNDPLRVADGVGRAKDHAPAGATSLDDVARWIEARREGPWFAFVHTYAIHDYFAPPELFARFDRGEPSAWRGDLATRLDPSWWRQPGNAPARADAMHLEDLYDATIRHVDDRLAAFFARLEAAGALDRAIVVITSDHGEEFLDHGGLQHSLTLYQEQLHVPLFVRLPEAMRGVSDGPTFVDAPFALADLAPTLLDLLGFDPAAAGNGRSRAALFGGGAGAGAGAGAADAGSPLLAELDLPDAKAQALRDGRFKLIRADTSDAVRYPAARTLEFFDLVADPRELRDLSDSDAVGAAAFLARLERLDEALRKNAARRVERALSSDVEAELRALGY